ncbi:hypothetical protein BpHYR1_023062 [Brachionus plicatilis]|uniref:Uncharacterized protein n=1 Tax=Brachionus plicatilis TaxID=10195 RepID=A0A3M7QB23_BRAPC|nr:hypothetical protein BpHYR1_023062 [Brachionus plicatilis]
MKLSQIPHLPNPDNQELREVPLILIKLWCLQQRVLKDMPRSNNRLEAWHKSFSQDIASHPCNNMLLSYLLTCHALGPAFRFTVCSRFTLIHLTGTSFYNP